MRKSSSIRKSSFIRHRNSQPYLDRQCHAQQILATLGAYIGARCMQGGPHHMLGRQQPNRTNSDVIDIQSKRNGLHLATWEEYSRCAVHAAQVDCAVITALQ